MALFHVMRVFLLQIQTIRADPKPRFEIYLKTKTTHIISYCSAGSNKKQVQRELHTLPDQIHDKQSLVVSSLRSICENWQQDPST